MVCAIASRVHQAFQTPEITTLMRGLARWAATNVVFSLAVEQWPSLVDFLHHVAEEQGIDLGDALVDVTAEQQHNLTADVQKRLRHAPWFRRG